MIKKLLAVIVLVMVASLSVVGCVNNTNTPSSSPTTSSSPTPAANADYSSYFNTVFTGGNGIVVQPFAKGTNNRGDDVYKGVGRNSSLPESADVTTVIELTQSQARAKQLYDQTVAQKINEEFTRRPDWDAATKAGFPYITEIWSGQQSLSGQAFIVEYYYDSNVSPSWLFVTEAGGAGA
jgi:hypothetical protein